jgi:hypothetical protein
VVAVIRPADRVAGHLARIDSAVAFADQHTGILECGEERAFRACCGRGSAHLTAQRYPRRLSPATPRGLLCLGPCLDIGLPG